MEKKKITREEIENTVYENCNPTFALWFDLNLNMENYHTQDDMRYFAENSNEQNEILSVISQYGDDCIFRWEPFSKVEDIVVLDNPGALIDDVCEYNGIE